MRVACLVPWVAVALAGAVHAGRARGTDRRIDSAAGWIAAAVAAEANLRAGAFGVCGALGAAAVEAEWCVVAACSRGARIADLTSIDTLTVEVTSSAGGAVVVHDALHAGAELGVEHRVHGIRVAVGLSDAVAACGDLALVGGLVATLARRAGVRVSLDGGAAGGAVHALEKVGIADLVLATGDLVAGHDLTLNAGVRAVVAEEVRRALALVAFALTVAVANLVGGAGGVRAATRLTQLRRLVAVGHHIATVRVGGATGCAGAIFLTDEASRTVEVRGAGLWRLLADAREGIAYLTFGAVALVSAGLLDARAGDAGLLTGALRAVRALWLGARLRAVVRGVTDLARDAEVTGHRLALLLHQDAHRAQLTVIVRNTCLGLRGGRARSTRRHGSQRAGEHERKHRSLRDANHPLCYLHLFHNLYPHLAFDSMQIHCCVSGRALVVAPAHTSRGDARRSRWPPILSSSLGSRGSSRGGRSIFMGWRHRTPR